MWQWGARDRINGQARRRIVGLERSAAEKGLNLPTTEDKGCLYRSGEKFLEQGSLTGMDQRKPGGKEWGRVLDWIGGKRKI